MARHAQLPDLRNNQCALTTCNKIHHHVRKVLPPDIVSGPKHWENFQVLSFARLYICTYLNLLPLSAGSPTLRFFVSSLDHNHAKAFIPPFVVEFQEKLAISTAAEMLPLDLTAHRMSVIEIYAPSNLDSQSSSHTSLTTTQPMATFPPESPQLECQGVKPPLPTTPKPIFSRHPSHRINKSSSNNLHLDTTNVKPATTNFLDEEERADLVRKSRKLTRLFGETPNAEAVVNQAGLQVMPTGPAYRKNSAPDANLTRRRDVRGSDGLNTFSRRYSLPLSVDNMPFIDIGSSDADDQGSATLSNQPSSPSEDGIVQSKSRDSTHSIIPDLPVSFVEFSDDGSSTSVASRASILSSFSSKIAPISVLEDERRRKRDRLAKLYRFLGSQVPINLALGISDDSTASLPPPPKIPAGNHPFENRRSTILRHRRSSSAIPSATWSDAIERLKANLDDREKAIIVRRAQKMEKLFGVAPPVTLYHSPSVPSSGYVTPSDTSPLPQNNFPSWSSNALKSRDRQGTPESSKQLLARTDSATSIAQHDYHLLKAPTDSNSHSTFYNHYDHSLNCLNDIIDRDDKVSLAELHQALRGDTVTAVPHEWSAAETCEADEGDGIRTPTYSGHRSSISSLMFGSERRGSLPATTSNISLNSAYSITMPPPKPEATSFQQRRKRAAKLAHFFGVDYRELFDDVLVSIENDMQLRQRDGALCAEEVEDLLRKLRKLKSKRQTL